MNGIPDLRLAPDRYLSLEEDRAKALRLARIGHETDLGGLARAYYAMTEDVDDPRAFRFAAHVAAAEKRAERFLPVVPSQGQVLELGCGSGGMVAAATRRGLRIIGIDIASRWLMIASKRLDNARQERVGIVAANADALPWSGATFDTIFADSLIEHVANPSAILREAFRVAKPGASLVLISPNRYSLLRDPHVGLWGVGWLPRRWQARYVRTFRRCDWPVALRSSRDVTTMAIAAGWTIRSVQAAPSPVSGGVGWVYDLMRRLPIFRSILKTLGPLWMIHATRGEAP